MSNPYLEEALQLQPQLIRWRRDLHKIPEVSITLPKTVQYVTSVLDTLGISYEVLKDCSCITAVLGQGEKCILLRGDMDALPGTEQSGESFAADCGAFHGCGHDLHTTAMLGTAALLKKHESELTAKVKLLFQSGEETFLGAKAAIAAGVLDNPKVDAAFAMHSFAMYETGQIVWGDLFMAAVYGFRIRVHGVGGHGSQPEHCADPINAAVQIYQGLQELLARECPPRHAASLTIGHFEAGSAANAIPADALMEGTLRVFEPETRKLLIRRINELVPALAAAYRCTAEIEVLSDVPCNICDPEFTADCLKSVEGIARGIRKESFMGSEDFACFTELVPSSYLVIGAGLDDVSDPQARLGQHNPLVRFNENSLAMSTACYVSVAMDWMKKHA